MSGSKVLEFCSPFSFFLIQSCLRVPSMNRSAPEDPVPQSHIQRCLSAVESREQVEEEEGEERKKEDQEDSDGLHASPLRRSGAFRAHSYTNDSFKRHSWGPGKEFQDPMSW